MLKLSIETLRRIYLRNIKQPMRLYQRSHIWFIATRGLK